MTKTEKVAFITGANRGLGLETARQLGKTGVTIVMGVRDLEKGKEALKSLQAEGVKGEAIAFDVTDPKSAKKVFDHFKEKYGKLDILINNAGVMLDPQPGNSAATISEEVLRRTFDTNFFSVVRLTQVLLPLLLKSPAGRIVNLSSILGSLSIHSQPDSPISGFKAFAYDSSKTALNAFTVHLADALRDTKVKVNSVHPGWVKTEMGGEAAPMEIPEGGKTSVRLATIGADGPTGGFFHMDDTLPW
jgi:NAD(P)-dependent dehydrogenase (short-subunit alcohol dehydrogenase family)